MRQFFHRLKGQPWASVTLSVISAILGIVAGPVVEAMSPPLFQGQNLAYLAFFISSFLFLVVAVYSLSFWNSALRRIDDTHSRISDLAKSLNVRFSFVPVGKGEAKRIYREVSKVIRLAKREILYLNYGPARQLESELSFDRAVAESTERQQYLNVLLRKIQTSETGQFRFRRIIQIPPNCYLTDWHDPLLIEHCKQLTGLWQISSLNEHKSL